MVQNACFFSQSGKKGSLESRFFSFALDFTSGVRATAWTNHRTGKSLVVSDGAEVVVEVDTAVQRIPITGWRANLSGIFATSAPDDETGYKQGFHKPEFNDSAWIGCMNPTELAFSGETLRATDPDQCLWARTHVFIPESLESEELSIVLGGVGLMDFRFMRVFLNGQPIGVRREKDRWHEAGKFKIVPNSKNHSFIRFGLDNVIAIQMADTSSRTPELDQLDPEYGRALALTCCWPAQFEQYIVAGKALQKLNLRPGKAQAMKQGNTARVQIELRSAKPKVAVTITYEWDSKDPVLNKRIEIKNEDKAPLRIMNLGLGSYPTKAKVTDGEQGFPVYIDKEFFATLAHPAGWAMGQKGLVELWQYPGKILAPGETMQSMSAMLGVGEKNGARKEFVSQVEKRMRRIVRGHDKPYAIFEPYGCWPIPHGEIISVEESDDILLPSIKRVAEGQRKSGCKFDIYSIDFWLDAAGDFERPDPKRFPDGFKNVLAELRKAGIAPGLWLTASQGGWANGKNPALSHCDTSDQAYRGGGGTISRDALNICRAEEPARSMFINGLGKQIHENGVRMIKFDGFWPICYNPHHGHLPGIYSTEAFFDAAIEFFQAMDAASPTFS